MVISKTPLRCSFAGGGSDLPSFYEKQPGAVVSTAIDKYMYIAVNKRFEDSIRVSYSITEIVKKPEELKHELAREALLFLGIKKGIEIVSVADVPGRGTGLGSSSAYTVGLLNALHAYENGRASAETLARQACHIEIERCNKPIGKQDHYAAAYGNLNYIEFNPDSSVFVNPIICKKRTRQRLQDNLMMFYTGMTRSSGVILKKQNEGIKSSTYKREILSRMVELAKEMKVSLENNNLDRFGGLLHRNWELKKELAGGISNAKIDGWYRTARRHGAMGKLLGAGGGGFLLLYAPQKKHKEIIKALPGLRHTPFRFELEGSKIIYFGD